MAETWIWLYWMAVSTQKWNFWELLLHFVQYDIYPVNDDEWSEFLSIWPAYNDAQGA